MSLGAAIKAPSAWKYGITDDLLQGPVAWPFSERFTSQAVNHTSHSHPFFKCFPVFQSQLLTHNLLLYQFSQPPSPMCHPHLCYCCTVLFSPDFQENEWNRWVLVCLTGIWWFAPKTHEKRLTKRETVSKNTRLCLWDVKILPRKLKQSLALFTNMSKGDSSRLQTPMVWSFWTVWNQTATVATRWLHCAHHMVNLLYLAAPLTYCKNPTLSSFDLTIQLKYRC